MENKELVEVVKNETLKDLPKNLSKRRQKKLENCLNDFLNIAVNDIDKKEYDNADEIKEFILRILAEQILNKSCEVFDLDDFDNDYDEIMQKIAFVTYEVSTNLLETEVSEDEFYSTLEYKVQKNYSKIIKEVGSKYRKQIKDTELARNSAYFWQLIFIKYTSDNNRIFYPIFLSDGYFITSEEQFKNYQKFGNKFFIICLCLLVFMAKFKLLKAIFYFKLLSLQSFGILVGLLVVIGIIYNLIVTKVIFKGTIKTQEKFWVNNYENVKFLKALIGKNLIVFLVCAVLFFAGCFCREIYGAFLALGSILYYFYYLHKQNQKIKLFVITQEKNAIKSFILNEINKYEDIQHISKIKENLFDYLNDYADYLYKVTELDYIAITDKLHRFIRSFVRFNKTLYALKINEEKHMELIEERFLNHFEYV